MPPFSGTITVSGFVFTTGFEAFDRTGIRTNGKQPASEKPQRYASFELGRPDPPRHSRACLRSMRSQGRVMPGVPAMISLKSTYCRHSSHVPVMHPPWRASGLAPMRQGAKAARSWCRPAQIAIPRSPAGTGDSSSMAPQGAACHRVHG